MKPCPSVLVVPTNQLVDLSYADICRNLAAIVRDKTYSLHYQIASSMALSQHKLDKYCRFLILSWDLYGAPAFLVILARLCDNVCDNMPVRLSKT